MRKTGRNEGNKDRKSKENRKQTFPLYVDCFVSLTQNYSIPVFLAVHSSWTSQYQYDLADTVHKVQISCLLTRQLFDFLHCAGLFNVYYPRTYPLRMTAST